MIERTTIDEWLLRAYGEQGDCPPPEVFLAAEWEVLGPQERKAVKDHLEHCPACAAERDLAVAFDTASEEMSPALEANLERLLGRLDGQEHGDQAAQRVLRFPAVIRLLSPRAYGLAAAAMVLLVAGIVVRSMGGGAPPLPRAPVEDATRSSTVDIVAPVGQIESFPEQLLWLQVEGALEYRVTMTEVDETPLWSATVSTPPVELPEPVRARLQESVVYFWFVEALDSAGSRIAWSEPVSFETVNTAAAEAL
ncbi:MAG: hypothetical protein OEM62_10775 [Acidobacteriota bacterium]|nr:hypothetical protein [Acidobacteriota bacterium]